jgi:hypothetical protein
MLFEDAFVDPPSILRRLVDAFLEAISDFSRDPKAYIISAFKGDGIGGHRRKMLLRFGLAIGIVVYAVFFGAILVLWSIHAKAKDEGQTELEVHMINPDDFKQQQIEMPKAEKKAGGGGGGGRETPTPASKGQLPKFSLTPPMIAPRPEPTPRPPSLPVPETVMVDPRLEPKRDELALTGLPNGVPGPPSAGPGSGAEWATVKVAVWAQVTAEVLGPVPDITWEAEIQGWEAEAARLPPVLINNRFY